MTSNRPYFIRALNDWILDNDMTPHLLVDADFPGTEVLALDAFPKGNDHIGLPATAKLVKDSGVDAIIIGNAA